MIRFTVHGQPVGKGRPRFSKRGRFVSAYTPKATKDYEALVRASAAESGVIAPLSFLKPVRVRISAYRQIPKSWTKKKRAEMEDQLCVTKPDADNLLKIIMDAVFEDDACVALCSCVKLWSSEPRVCVLINEIDGNDVGVDLWD